MFGSDGEVSDGYRQVGSGIVNAYNAIELIDNGDYVAGSITASETEDVISIGTLQAGQKVTITLAFLKRARFTSGTHSINSSNFVQSDLSDLDLYICPANLYLQNYCSRTSGHVGGYTSNNNVEKIIYTATVTGEHLICIDKYEGQGSYEIIYGVSWLVDDNSLK